MNCAERLVTLFGSQAEVARRLRLDRAVVSNWVKSGYVPARWAMEVEALTSGGISAVEVLNEANTRKPLKLKNCPLCSGMSAVQRSRRAIRASSVIAPRRLKATPRFSYSSSVTPTPMPSPNAKFGAPSFDPKLAWGLSSAQPTPCSLGAPPRRSAAPGLRPAFAARGAGPRADATHANFGSGLG